MKLLRGALVGALCLGLLAALPPAGADERSLDSLLNEGNRIRTADPAQMDRLLQVLDGRIADADPAQRTRWQLLHAHRAITKGETETAIATLRTLVDGDGDVETRFVAASMLANSYAILRRFEEALVMVDRMLALRQRVEDRAVLHRGLMVAAVVYNQVGEYRLGMHYAEDVARNAPDPRNHCAAGGVIMESHVGLSLTAGDAQGQQAIDRCVTAGEPIFTGFVRAHLAREWDRQGRTRDAATLLQTSLADVTAIGYPFLIAHYQALLADFRMTLGEHAPAQRHAQRAIDLGGAGSSEAMVTAHRVLYELAERRGDAVEALRTYRAYAEAQRAYTEDMKSREMAYQVVRHQSSQQAQQIELLRQRNQLLELQKRVTEQRAQNWLVAAALLVFLLATTGYWAFRTKRLQMRMQRMAQTDPLTRISNRHHFSEQATRALAQCAREGRVAALVTFDLDHFKQINDRFGHAAGDWALCQVTKACVPLRGPEDAFGRLGGEEFALLFPGCDASAARQTAAAAMTGFAAIDATGCGYDMQLTASFGITDTLRSGHDFTRLLSHADKAMYRAKRSGRNRLCVYDTTPPPVEAPCATPRPLPPRLLEDVLHVADAASRARRAALP
ncbi:MULTISPECIES: tetratricopeptide repeat-containing diguanylate cyclase [Luteimonas]|uniref:tetratricopeptide repeat-containing diguanylate cyclase n=1 Tax=Luteimonas TaxID=83614 RepID=UPI0013042739|nr:MULTISPECIES: GGDEF domain-containing protein [Luteimonas]